MLLQILLQVPQVPWHLPVQTAVNIVVIATLTAFALMCLMVVHLPIMYGVGTLVPVPLSGHAAANSRFVWRCMFSFALKWKGTKHKQIIHEHIHATRE